MASVALCSACPAPWPSLVVEPRSARRAAPPATLFKGVMVFDAREGMLTGPSDVRVSAGQIREISPEIPPLPGEDVVPGEGRTLLPGFIDAHVHLGLSQGEAPWAPAVADPRAQAGAPAHPGGDHATGVRRDRPHVRGAAPAHPFERRLMRPGAEKGFEQKGDLGRYPRAPKDLVEKMHQRGELAGRNVKSLVDGGAVVLVGTDSGLPGLFHGAALHEELSALVALGVSPAAAIRMATYVPGRVLLPDGSLGAIEVGAWADLVLVDGDPTRDIQATRNIAGVWQRGRKVQRR
jgi:imidazolonepropionase-like amidohydrolase